MPTPSDITGVRLWEAKPEGQPQSVFTNYGGESAAVEDAQPAAARPPPESPGSEGADVAVARSFIYRFLAQAFEYPSVAGWQGLIARDTRNGLASAQAALAPDADPEFAASGNRVREGLRPEFLAGYTDAFLSAFGHAARGSIPMNEIEYGEAKADPLFQPHRLADLAAYYRAFGLAVADDAAERQDHLCLELEFMSVLAAKEAYAHQQGLGPEHVAISRAAQKGFLRDHLGRWSPSFGQRLCTAALDPLLRDMATLLEAFVRADCARFGVRPGSADLVLRPVEDAAERLCDSCGLNRAPPGA